jgi:hypothetical protein
MHWMTNCYWLLRYIRDMEVMRWKTYSRRELFVNPRIPASQANPG